MTQKEFAKAIGKSHRTVQGWEGESSTPSDVVIEYICDIFSVNYYWLLKGIGDMFIAKSSSSNIVTFGDFGTQIQSAGSIQYIYKDKENPALRGSSKEVEEFIELVFEYATPAMIKEWKSKLLKIKKILEE